MKAMILAAGRGERMRELSQDKPKPLQLLQGKPLIEYQIERLARAGIRDIMVNVSYLAEQIMTALGDGKRFGVKIHYSVEPEVLGTAGGVAHVLPFFENKPFILTSSDIWHDFDFAQLQSLPAQKSAHLILVPNPEHNPDGDFSLDNAGEIHDVGSTKETYAGIGLFSPELFKNLPEAYCSISSVLKQAIADNVVSGQHHQGDWRNIDTPERLNEMNLRLAV